MIRTFTDFSENIFSKQLLEDNVFLCNFSAVVFDDESKNNIKGNFLGDSNGWLNKYMYLISGAKIQLVIKTLNYKMKRTLFVLEDVVFPNIERDNKIPGMLGIPWNIAISFEAKSLTMKSEIPLLSHCKKCGYNLEEDLIDYRNLW